MASNAFSTMGYVILFIAAALWTASWFPDPPTGPVLRFGLESNAAAFLINTAILVAFVYLIRHMLLVLSRSADNVKNDPSPGSRVKWYGLNYINTLLILSLLGALNTYLTGASPGFTFGLKSELARLLANVIVTSIVATPLYMWQDAIEERGLKNRDGAGFFERLGQRAGNYLGKRCRK